MASPTYVARKVGDQYVVVPKNPPGTVGGAAWLLGGAVCVLAGTTRRGICGGAMGLVGAGMLFRGATGLNPLMLLCPGCRRGGRDGGPDESPSFQHDDQGLPTRQAPEDEVDEAAMESFPASDPPARSATASP